MFSGRSAASARLGTMGRIITTAQLLTVDALPTEVAPTKDKRMQNAAIDHPAYYGGADNPYEAIKVIEAWDLGFCLGNTVKYIARAGRKDAAKLVEDLEKARWYLDREIARLKGK